MPTPSLKQQLIKGETLFEAGNFEGALQVFQHVLKHKPDNPYALNDAGLTAQKLGQVAEAMRYFKRALEADPRNASAFFNLIDLLAQEDEADLAWKVFQAYEAEIPNSAEKERYREALFARPNSSGCEEQDLRDRLQKDEHADEVLKVAFICGPDQKFIIDIEQEIARRHHVRTFHFNESLEVNKVQEAMDWADVVWFEWCDEILVRTSNKLRKTSRVVCRLHSYEAFSKMPTRVNWSFVDTLVVVGSHVRRLVNMRISSIEDHIDVRIIPNAVDLNRFTFKTRGPGFNLAYIGYINYKKNPELLLQCLSALIAVDARYKLHIAGEFQQPRYLLYFEKMIPALGLEDNIRFHGWVDNIETWLDDKQYLISTSLFESFGYGIAEAMARGIKPVIHNFPGAEDIYTRKWLFNTVPELVKHVTGGSYDSRAYRRHIEQNYSLEAQVEDVDELLKSPSTNASTSKNNTPATSGNGPFDRPDRNLIVSGIPRSGTSLFSVLVNEIDNAVCLNEVLYDLEQLPEHFAALRKHLVEGKPIPNKYNENGTLTTNTLESGVVTAKKINGTDQNVVIGSKVTIPYLAQLSRVLDLGYPIIAIIRDPVYTIGSWNTKKACELREAKVTDDHLDPLYQNFPFSSNNRFERQAEIWQHWAHLLWAHRNHLTIVKYEDVVANTKEVVGKVCRLFDLMPPSKEFDLENMNRDARYDHIGQVRSAVEKHAPISVKFGYAYGSKISLSESSTNT